MPESFLGTGWAFPVQVDAGGGIRTRSVEEDIKEAIGVILWTRLGERAMRPEFGCGAGDLVFDPNDAGLAGRVEFHVRRALERWEPRIALKEVRAVSQGERLDVDVRYVVRATNREDNVVVPFFTGDLP